jgi:hypothetical protein
MSTREKFYSDVQRFLRRHQMPPTRLGEAINDRGLLTRLAKGKGVNMKKMDACYNFMDAYNKAHPTRRASARAA